MLNRATCRLVVRQRSTLWIRGSWSRRPPAKRAFFSKVGLFRSCAPDRPNLEKRRVKAGPTQISKQISRNLGLGQVPEGQGLSPGVSRCRRCQRCRGSVEGVSRECRLTLVSRCRGCRGSVDGDLDIRDALMLSRCQRCQGGGWAHGQSKLIGVQSVPTAQGMSPYHNTSPQYTLEPQRRGLSTFPA